jgi:hypothetical protein
MECMVYVKLIRNLLLPVAVAIAMTAAPKAPIGPKDKAVAKWTNQQLQSILPVPAERIFDKIGWADNLIRAEELAKSSGRPIFLFTYDGDLAAGRC